MAERYTHATRAAPGCHGEPDWLGPVVSRHRTYGAAERAARRCDRLVVVEVDEDGEAGHEVLYQVPRQDHPRYGAGRYGLGERT